MKKITGLILLSTSVLLANPLGGLTNQITDAYNGLFAELNELTNGYATKCFNKPALNINNICASLNSINNPSITICDDAETLRLKELAKDYCAGMNKNATSSRLNDFDIYQRNSGFGKGNYATPEEKDFYTKTRTAMVSDKRNVVNSNLNKTDTTTMRYILKNSKKGTVNLASADTSKLTAPATTEEYTQARYAVATALTQEQQRTNVVNTDVSVKNAIKGKQGASAQAEADKIVQSEFELIEASAQKEIGFEIERQAKDDDIAIPTQDYINVLREDLKAPTLAKIEQQMNREARISADIMLKADQQKQIVRLTAQKAVILNEKFDRETAQKNINALIN